MTDWTLIATTLGTALITGGFGYAAARRSAAVAMRQIEEESLRAEAQRHAEQERLQPQVDAERESAREAAAEAERRGREPLYENFLTFEDRMRSTLTRYQEFPEGTVEELRQLGARLSLVVPTEIQKALAALLVEWEAIFKEILGSDASERREATDKAFATHETARRDARSKLTGAMYLDLRPR